MCLCLCLFKFISLRVLWVLESEVTIFHQFWNASLIGSSNIVFSFPLLLKFWLEAYWALSLYPPWLNVSVVLPSSFLCAAFCVPNPCFPFPNSLSAMVSSTLNSSTGFLISIFLSFLSRSSIFLFFKCDGYFYILYLLPHIFISFIIYFTMLNIHFTFKFIHISNKWFIYFITYVKCFRVREVLHLFLF